MMGFKGRVQGAVRCICITGTAVLWGCSPRPAGDAGNLSPGPAQHSQLANRIPFFRDRLTSPNVAVRYELMLNIGENLPLPEAEKVLRAMMKDPDAAIRDQAVRRLLAVGCPVRPSELPPLFAGVDRADSKALADFRDKLRGTPKSQPGRENESLENNISAPGAAAGYAAQLLGVLGDETDIPRLEALLNRENIYVRFTAANALINLGAEESGRKALTAIADAKSIPDNYFYIRQALLNLHRMGDRNALANLASHLKSIESSAEPNARSNYVQGLKALACLTGTWKNSASEWQESLPGR